MKKNMKQGFTLIELLIVIAIIGILAGVILVSTSSARTKANVAAFKSEVAGATAGLVMACDSGAIVIGTSFPATVNHTVGTIAAGDQDCGTSGAGTFKVYTNAVKTDVATKCANGTTYITADGAVFSGTCL